MLLTASAKELAFTFCSLEAKCETLMKSNLHLWMPMKRLALFATIEKPCPHTAGSKTCPPHQQTSAHPLPFTRRPPPLALLLGGISQRLFHYCVVWPRTPAGSPFIHPSPGGFQSQPRAPPHPRHTHSDSHTSKRPNLLEYGYFSRQICPFLSCPHSSIWENISIHVRTKKRAGGRRS